MGDLSAHSLLTALLLTHLCLLRQLNLSNNRLCGVWTEDGNQHGNYNAEGINAIADALRVNGALTSIDFSGNTLCGLDWEGKGIYTAEGITAIADALRVNGGLTSLNLSDSWLCGLDFFGRGTYTAEGITAIADALRVNGGLAVINLLGNQLDAESAKMLAEVAKQKGISLCGIKRDLLPAMLPAMLPPNGLDDDEDVDGEEGEDEEDDFPDVGLEEMLDELTLGAGEPDGEGGEDEDEDGEGGAARSRMREIGPVMLAAPQPAIELGGPTVEQFQLPEGSEVKFCF